MVTYTPQSVLDGNNPGPWGEPVSIAYTERDVLLYAVGIGCTDLRFVYEKNADFAVFPTFPIRWSGRGGVNDDHALPPSPGPLTLDAERSIEMLAPLPLSGTVNVRSRLIAVHPRGKGHAFVERESEVVDADGTVCVRMVAGSFRRGVGALGDIQAFEGRGLSRSVRMTIPDRMPDVDVSADIASNQAHLYRLSGDYNPLHIDPEAARFGGFNAPILHGLCTLGHCAHLLLSTLCGDDPRRFRSLQLRFSAPVYPGDRMQVIGWYDAPGRLSFEARVGTQTVISNAVFTYH